MLIIGDTVYVLNQLSVEIYDRNVQAGWYTDIETGKPLQRNIGEMFALIHSEVSEGLEGYRKNLFDDHLPHRMMVEVELADTLIRIFDLAGYQGYNIGTALVEKLEYNRNRADHKIENRLLADGKKI